MSEEPFPLCPYCRKFSTKSVLVELGYIIGICKETGVGITESRTECIDFSGILPEKKEVVIQH
ncbi:MAG: hypothetical protein GPJ51_08345 [Candidatus Heimdallarchaeota archaeon]|nr:hypothetical protein [Candidatus Heimdallarchaeota archaeon]